MRVYIIDQDGFYMAFQDCQPSPLEPGKFLTPKKGTFSEIEPSFVAGKWPRIVAGKWTQVDDKRGTDIYKTETGAKEKCQSVEIPEGYTDKVPGVDDKWNGSAWVLDTKKRDARIAAEATMARESLISAKVREMAEAALVADGKIG
jgi:hypothetical protein